MAHPDDPSETKQDGTSNPSHGVKNSQDHSSTSPIAAQSRTMSSSAPNGSDGEVDADADADVDASSRIAQLESALSSTTAEKDQLETQYRTLLGKLTAMRQSLGDKLREDAEELDRRETQINQLTQDLSTTNTTLSTLRTELSNLTTENSLLSSQLSQLRYESSSSSSDVIALTRELRDLRGEMEMLRVEREEWEVEAGTERKRREELEDEVARLERRCVEERSRAGKAEDGARRENERAANLQDVLEEFQAGKDVEIRQATKELETQLRQTVQSLAEYKVRALEAETHLTDISNDTAKSAKLEREIKEKNAIIGKLRHDAVLTQEHLTEALRRLRRSTSDTNVDRRLVTNILLQFLCTPRADPKRFEMLSLLSTILGWDEDEREKAGLQRGTGSGYNKGKRKDEVPAVTSPRRSKEDEETFNESFSNLFVEFLLKEAAQGESRRPSTVPLASPSAAGSIHGAMSPPLFPPPTGFQRNRTLSSTSLGSTTSGMGPPPSTGGGGGGMRSPPMISTNAYGRKISFGMQQQTTSPQTINGTQQQRSGEVSPGSTSPMIGGGRQHGGHVPLPR